MFILQKDVGNILKNSDCQLREFYLGLESLLNTDNIQVCRDIGNF